MLCSFRKNYKKDSRGRFTLPIHKYRGQEITSRMCLRCSPFWSKLSVHIGMPKFFSETVCTKM